MRAPSITLRLTAYFVGAATAVLLLLGTVIGARVDSHFEQQDLGELAGKLELVRHAVARARNAGELEAATRPLSDALVGHHHLSVGVRAADGRWVFRTPEAQFPQALVDSAMADLQPLVWEQAGRALRGISAPAPLADAALEPARVLLALDIVHHLEFMAAFRLSLWLALLAGVALTVLGAWLAARGGLAPIRRLADSVQGISAGRLGERLPTARMPAELIDLAAEFNRMLARLEESFQRLSHFSSDLAHELRTPISNLMTETQVAISKARSADEYREVLYSNLEEHERLARMIGDMLFLAKADNGLVVPSRDRVDLAHEVQDLFGFYDAYAEEQGVGLQLHGGGEACGDRLMIRRALSNLLANAISHTARGQAVTVRIEAGPQGSTRVSVENPGPPIAAEHLPHLFDRFYRVDPARHSAGAGLGLAITQSILRAHGAEIDVNCAAGMTRFAIRFPPLAPGCGASAGAAA